MDKIKHILLIDDDYATNKLHQIHIKKLGIVDSITVVNNGKEALEVLFDENFNPKLIPELIFLDINMPIMGGWEFIESYQKLSMVPLSKIIMLTASINPQDQTLGKTHPFISGYVGKPLNEEKLRMFFEPSAPSNL